MIHYIYTHRQNLFVRIIHAQGLQLTCKTHWNMTIQRSMRRGDVAKNHLICESLKPRIIPFGEERNNYE